MRNYLLAAVLVVTFLGGCQTVAPPATTSGRPEVTINKADPARVKSIIVSKMLDKGYRVVKDEQFSLTFEKPSESFAANLLLSSSAGGIPAVRVSYAIADLSGSVRVVADMALISNAGMAFERRTDISKGADSPLIQSFLDQVATDASAANKTARR